MRSDLGGATWGSDSVHSSDFCRRGPLLDFWLCIEYVQLSWVRVSGLCGGQGRARGTLHDGDERACL